ncbi:MAG: 16S rRNA (guanine(527)-N(7))-methyltransferase RsmG [Clostridia bacterium]|nr:16S rRNA (guanine(527)-N(7))-methyltransferase RsmG [Clostridia bacterium]
MSITEINEKAFKSELTKVFGANRLSSLLSLERVEKFYRLTVRMLEENEKYNLTAITETDKIILNHYADCATLAARLKKGAKIADIGCGAGFPTLPLAILRPDLTITAIDSTAKRINYVAESARLLGLDNVTAIAMRAEEGGASPEHREKYDYVTARAVAEMRVLSELCLPYVKVGGQMVAMKGKNAQFELQSAKKAIATLGGRGAKCEDITLKSDTEVLTHPLIIIDKGTKTPAAYPRPYAKISKQPL